MTEPSDHARIVDVTPVSEPASDPATDPTTDDAATESDSKPAVDPVIVRAIDPAADPAPKRPLTRIEVQPSQVVAATGTAIVAAVKMGRLLSRSGWKLARQLPGGRLVEREAQRIQATAVTEARRLLQIPIVGAAAGSAEERRAVDYIRNTDVGPAPLRSAMSELLERSVEASRTDSRQYLYGTIISQLVPDEARILAALADGTHFAACDVVQKQRHTARTLLAHASTIGRQAGLTTPDNVPTYLTRLYGFGLVEFGAPDPALDVQYDILETDAAVQRARESVEGSRRSTARIVRSTLAISPFGREFWAATDPSRSSG